MADKSRLLELGAELCASDRNGIVWLVNAKSAPARKGLIEKMVLIQASPPVVFQALTEAKDLVRWFCDRADSDPRVGGQLNAYWKADKSGQSGRAIFTIVAPDSLVELDWIDDVPPASNQSAKHLLRYQIRPKRESTEVLLHDEGFCPPDKETFAVLDEGWNSVLLELKDFCERKERASKRKPASLSGQTS